MKKKVLIAFVALALVISGCAVRKAASPTYSENYGAMPTPAPNLGARTGDTSSQSGAPQPEAPAAPSVPAKGGGGTTAATQRLIAVTVDLSIIVDDPQKKMNEINQMATELGGFLVSMSMSQVYAASGDKVPQGTISIRVPAAKLSQAINQIEADIVDVTSDNRYGQDVTSQYVDLQSQLKNMQQAEQDLLAIMDEAKNNPGNDSTTKTQDVLNVYNQIVSIRGQIESIQGQMKYIEETTSTSAITVNLVAAETVQPIKVGQWQPKVTANQAFLSLVKFMQNFVNFLIIFFVKVLPELIIILGPIALILWAVIAGIKRRRARKLNAA